jgi:hypothetical protein
MRQEEAQWRKVKIRLDLPLSWLRPCRSGMVNLGSGYGLRRAIASKALLISRYLTLYGRVRMAPYMRSLGKICPEGGV